MLTVERDVSGLTTPLGNHRGMLRIARVMLSALGLLSVACSPTPTLRVSPKSSDSAATRFVYIVNCDARVDKLDTIEMSKVESFLLSERSGSPPAVPSAPNGQMDGCLAQRVVADAKGEKVSLIAPMTARLSSDGLQEFQALTFSLPQWKLTDTRPAGKLPEAPRLELDAKGDVRVVNDAQWTPVTTLDLSKYRGLASDATGLVLASSGHTALLSLLSTTSDKLVLGLVDLSARGVTRLDHLPPTNLGHVHLAPGGGHVLVEATERADPDSKSTGALQLYDAAGKLVGEWQHERIRSMSFVALTPNGTAVYRSNTAYHFLAMGLPFGADSVIKPMPELAEPGVVFSAQ